MCHRHCQSAFRSAKQCAALASTESFAKSNAAESGRTPRSPLLLKLEHQWKERRESGRVITEREVSADGKGLRESHHCESCSCVCVIVCKSTAQRHMPHVCLNLLVCFYPCLPRCSIRGDCVSHRTKPVIAELVPVPDTVSRSRLHMCVCVPCGVRTCFYACACVHLF